MQSVIHRSYKRGIQTILLSVALSLSLAAGARDIGENNPVNTPVIATHAPHACPARADQMLLRMQQHHKRKLDRLAQQLQLQAGQQAAWQAYVQAEEAIPTPPPCPKPGQHAPDIAQARAAHAGLMASRLDLSSKALAALWLTLSPAQQQTFDRLTVSAMHPRGMPAAPAGAQ